MKKLFYILAAALMVLASVSCTKERLPLYMKGTTWVFSDPSIKAIAVMKFKTRTSFTTEQYSDEGQLFLKATGTVVDVKGDEVYYEFTHFDVYPEYAEWVASEGIIILVDRQNIDVLYTDNHWTDVDYDEAWRFRRDDKFKLSNYLR